MSNCKDIGIQQVNELPIDDLESVPDYFLVVREFPDKTTFTRLPGSRVMPNGTLDNVFSLSSNNPDLTVPENQVVPAYVSNEVTSNIVLPANGNNRALFLLIGIYGNYAICQNVGVINILAGHQYIIGQQYYLAKDGGVTTSATDTGQKLFIPISKQKLLLNISY